MVNDLSSRLEDSMALMEIQRNYFYGDRQTQ